MGLRHTTIPEPSWDTGRGQADLARRQRGGAAADGWRGNVATSLAAGGEGTGAPAGSEPRLPCDVNKARSKPEAYVLATNEPVIIPVAPGSARRAGGPGRREHKRRAKPCTFSPRNRKSSWLSSPQTWRAGTSSAASNSTTRLSAFIVYRPGLPICCATPNPAPPAGYALEIVKSQYAPPVDA